MKEKKDIKEIEKKFDERNRSGKQEREQIKYLKND